MAWRAELLPGLSPSPTSFRIPAWVVGERERSNGTGSAGADGAGDRERYEDLRRRLEGEVAASGSGVEGAAGQRRRTANAGGDPGQGMAQNGVSQSDTRNRLADDW